MLSLKTKISTPNVKACAAFYEDLLGLHRVETWDDPNDAGIILALGPTPHSALIELSHHETESDFRGLSLQFKVDDLCAFLDTVPDGLAYVGPTARPWGARYAYFTDPAGVSVIICDGPTY
jgi:catechol 2,3-dioxygenase-like lactoylglutathione lyase family enzyme